MRKTKDDSSPVFTRVRYRVRRAPTVDDQPSTGLELWRVIVDRQGPCYLFGFLRIPAGSTWFRMSASGRAVRYQRLFIGDRTVAIGSPYSGPWRKTGTKRPSTNARSPKPGFSFSGARKRPVVSVRYSLHGRTTVFYIADVRSARERHHSRDC